MKLSRKAPKSWSSLEPEVRDALDREVELEVARRSISGAMVYFAVVVLLALSTDYPRDHPAILATAGLLMLLVGAARIMAARRILSLPAAVVPDAARLLLITIYATTILWGLFCAGTLQLYPGRWPAMFLMLSTAALASGVSSSLAPDLMLALHSLLLLITPTIVSALLVGDRGHAAFGIATAMYLAFLMVQAKGNWRAFWTANVAAEREKIRGSEERRRAETERAILAAAIEHSAEEILITDVNGSIQYCNPAFERLTGYSRAEAAGRNPRFLKSDRHDAAFYADLWATVIGGRVWSGRITNRKKDGSLYQGEGTISPIYGAGGELAGFVSARHDVTERLRLESELRQAQKLESIGRLAGGIAHDFNNLLTVIIGYSQLLLDEDASADHAVRRVYAEEIHNAAERAASLTRQLLSFSRKQILVPKPVALDALIEEMQPMLQRLVGEDVQVAASAEPSLGLVRADPGQMGQILMNLAANARDAMPGGGRLTIRAENVEPADMPRSAPEGLLGNPAVLLTVSDTGAGMDDETRQQIFEPFFTTKERGRGTGLGLATVYGIVQQSEGHVEVESEPGRGTTFRIYLPRAEAGAVAAASPEETLRGIGGHETVLVAEDQDDLRKLVTTFLRARGFRVLEAPDGRAALALAAGFPAPIDLLVTDVIMPDITGKQLADELAPSRPDMRILYMSGYSGDVIAQRGVLDESVSYLAKPFTVEALAAKVREVLGPPREVRPDT
jgi:PAS domain S-box-containing protein